MIREVGFDRGKRLQKKEVARKVYGEDVIQIG